MPTNGRMELDLATEGDNSNLRQLLREAEGVLTHHNITLVVDIVTMNISIMIITMHMAIRDTQIDKVCCLYVFLPIYNVCWSGWSSQWSRGGSRGGRGQSGGYRNQQGGQGGRQQQQQPTGRGGQHKSTNTNAATKKSIKFDGDFDFESSNAKFKKEQMEEEFKQKLKLDGRKDSDSSG